MSNNLRTLKLTAEAIEALDKRIILKPTAGKRSETIMEIVQLLKDEATYNWQLNDALNDMSKKLYCNNMNPMRLLVGINLAVWVVVIGCMFLN